MEMPLEYLSDKGNGKRKEWTQNRDLVKERASELGQSVTVGDTSEQTEADTMVNLTGESIIWDENLNTFNLSIVAVWNLQLKEHSTALLQMSVKPIHSLLITDQFAVSSAFTLLDSYLLISSFRQNSLLHFAPI